MSILPGYSFKLISLEVSMKMISLVCRGTILIDKLGDDATGILPDTYINVRGWGKGLAFINGFNLGWYWPTVGPQGTQYIPGPLLKPGKNEIILVETATAPNAKSGGAQFLLPMNFA